MWRDEASLLDMLIAARDAQEFSKALTYKLFQRLINTRAGFLPAAATRVSGILASGPCGCW